MVYSHIPQISIEEAILFIRKHDALMAWSDLEIQTAITNASKQAALAFTTEDNKLTGICFGEWIDKGKTLFVHCLIAPRQYKVYTDYLKKYFPSCEKIEGNRGPQSLVKIYEV